MIKTKGTGIFIYGNKSKDFVQVTWDLSYGEALSNEETWRAIITTVDTSHVQQVDVKILDAHDRDFIFKLKTDNGSVFPCGIYDIDHMIDAYPILHFEICNPEQKMGKFLRICPNQT